jgi:hypothetical protein
MRLNVSLFLCGEMLVLCFAVAEKYGAGSFWAIFLKKGMYKIAYFYSFIV